mmetsp:Transcript_41245/g.90553  ORF Transcript_41245/g.90553 Transcript_41245/m.90553 type:complete len:249 (+) Transcript_41245:540-1286(+)
MSLEEFVLHNTVLHLGLDRRGCVHRVRKLNRLVEWSKRAGKRVLRVDARVGRLQLLDLADQLKLGRVDGHCQVLSRREARQQHAKVEVGALVALVDLREAAHVARQLRRLQRRHAVLPVAGRAGQKPALQQRVDHGTADRRAAHVHLEQRVLPVEKRRRDQRHAEQHQQPATRAEGEAERLACRCLSCRCAELEHHQKAAAQSRHQVLEQRVQRGDGQPRGQPHRRQHAVLGAVRLRVPLSVVLGRRR